MHCCIFYKFGGEQEETIQEQSGHLRGYVCIKFEEHIQDMKDRKQSLEKKNDGTHHETCHPCIKQTGSLLNIPFHPLYMS